METESNYLIANPKLVLDKLNSLIKNRCIVSAFFGDPEISFMTSIISIEPKKKIIELDCAQDEKLNTQLLNSAKVQFRTEIDGIKVSFAGKNIKQTKSNGEKVFTMPLPESVFWMQRRQYYRVKIPSAHTHCYCEVLLQIETDVDGEIIMMPHISRFKLEDLSITGLAYHNTTPAFANLMRPSMQYTNSILRLHDDNDTEIRFSFEIINVNKIRSSGGGIIAQRVGCKFTELPIGFEDILQRYIQDIEIQKRAIT
jgi:c-di-GMP-binding flagellar brake protein YcgR